MVISWSKLWVIATCTVLMWVPGYANADDGVPRGKTTSIACVEFPDISYSIFVPESYSPDKPAALYVTFSPGGGGMVNQHKAANFGDTPVIIVGVRGSKNGAPLQTYIGEMYAVMHDTLTRFNLDPAAQYAAGFSGGGWNSFNAARFFKERISGVLSSGGWLMNQHEPWHQYASGLLVARCNGSDDGNANFFLKPDGKHLKKFKVRLKDWKQPGGHKTAQPEKVKEITKWFFANKSKLDSADKARETAEKWRSKSPNSMSLKAALSTIKTKPRTFLGMEAQKYLYEIMKDDATFTKLAITSSLRGQELTTYFGFLAYGAACAGDIARFKSAQYALLKVIKDRNSIWYGNLGILSLMAPHEGMVDTKAAFDLLKKPGASKSASVTTKLALAAALIKNNRKASVPKFIKPLDKADLDSEQKKMLDDVNSALKSGKLNSKQWLFLREGEKS